MTKLYEQTAIGKIISLEYGRVSRYQSNSSKSIKRSLRFWNWIIP